LMALRTGGWGWNKRTCSGLHALVVRLWLVVLE
jgi:hypothetical protein